MNAVGPEPRAAASPSEVEARRPRVPAAWTYGLVGILLGVGAPVGAFAIRALGGVVSDVSADLREHLFFYLYELVGSCLIFGVGGWLVGRRADRYRAGRDLYRDLAEHDSLTHLANARAFLSHQQRAIEHAARYNEPVSLLLLDVDELKTINDTLGHEAGHEALVRVADVLNDCKRQDDMAARWGGDEFAVLMRGADEAAATRQANAILERLRARPPRLGGRERPVTVTIGVATTRNGSADTLFQRADLALYAGKTAGRDRVVSDSQLPAAPRRR